jgi:hypothetical protein
MAKASLIVGRVIVAAGCVWLSVACDDMDRAVEQKANEMLGKEPAEPAPAETAPAVPETPEPAAPAEPAVPTPLPTPAPAEPVAEPAKPAAPAKPAKEVAEKPKAPEPLKPPTTKPVEPKPVEPAKPAKPVEVAKPIEPPKPVEPVKPTEPEKPAKPATKVTVPQSKHVTISVPSRVQELLNADPRMQPWINSTVGVIETCYAQVRKDNSSASGTISFVLEMHENARPDADITSLPPQLSGIVTCGTGKLMRAARMPLFTGKEGEKHTIKVKFTP